jgi:hypothetical protein
MWTENTGIHVYVAFPVFARAYAAPRFLGQEFGNNNSYISRTRFYLYDSKISWIAFAAL